MPEADDTHHNVWRATALFNSTWLLAFSIIAAGCDQPTAESASIEGSVAIANGEPIYPSQVFFDVRHNGDVVAVVDGISIDPDQVSVPAGARDLDARRERLDVAVLSLVASEEAGARGLLEDEAVARMLVKVRGEAIRRERGVLQNALFQSIREKIELTEGEIVADYEAHQRQYAARQIVIERAVFSNRRAASAAIVGADSPPAPVRVERLGPVPISDLPASVLPEAITLRREGQSALAEGEDGEWSVITLEEIDRARPLPLEAVRDRVIDSLRIRAASLRGECDWRWGSSASLAGEGRPFWDDLATLSFAPLKTAAI